MSRITEGEARGLVDAYRSIYEGYGEKKKEGKKKIMHNCATHVEHSEYGLGNCIKEMHTLDEEGNVSHYDVEFEHGIVENVPVSELNILVLVEHPHEANEMKNAEVLDEDLIGDVLLNRGKIKSAATRAITATNRAASATNKALGSAVSDTARQVKSGVKQTAKDVATGYKYGGTTGAATALGANIVRGIASAGQPAKPAPAKPVVTKPVVTKPVVTKPVVTKPVAPAAAKPTPSAPVAKPATPATTTSTPITSQPAVSKSQADAAEIRGMIGRSMERQADEVKRTAEIAKKSTQPPVAPGYQGAKKPFGEEVDAYDLVLDYLLENGHADTVDEAHYVMLEMDSKMIKSIVEGSYEERIADNNRRYNAARKRAAQRAHARNEARERGENVGSSRPERTTYTDSAGVERHHSGARMPDKK